MQKSLKLSEIHKLLDEAGNLQKLPEKFEISTKELGPSELSSLLILSRVYGKSSKSLLNERIPNLERTRHWIHHGEYGKALSHLPPIEQATSDELLEYARIFSFLGHWQAAADAAGEARDHSLLPTGNLALSYQIEGNSLTEIRQFLEGAQTLETSQDLYKNAGNDYGCFLTTLLRAKNERLAGDGQVDSFLNEALNMLFDKEYGFKGWLAYLRTLYLKPAKPNQFSADVLFASSILAKTLGDIFFESLSLLELSRITSIEISSELKNTQTLSPRHAALVQGKGLDSALLDWLQPGSVKDYRSNEIKNLRFVYLTQSEVMFDLKKQIIHRLQQDSPKTKILKLLAASHKPLERAEIFENVWNLSWSQERHGNLLVTTLKRVNELAPGILSKRSSRIELCEKGLVLEV